MGYPANPNTVILKNKYYPQGLKEIDVWNYYQKVKNKLLKEVRFRDLMIYIMTDKGPVIQRKGKSTRFIRLNPSNYDEIITGRTISIHSTMRRSEDIGIIDVDCDDFKWARAATIDTFEMINTKMMFVKKADIRFTGKTGFHIYCHLGRQSNIDATRFLFKKLLSESDLAKSYTVDLPKKRRGIPNLDLAPNKFRGGFITLHALSIEGLRCMELPLNRVGTFFPQNAKI